MPMQLFNAYEGRYDHDTGVKLVTFIPHSTTWESSTSRLFVHIAGYLQSQREIEDSRTLPMPIDMFTVTFSGNSYNDLLSVDVDELSGDGNHVQDTVSLGAAFTNQLVSVLINVHTSVAPSGGITLDFSALDGGIQGFFGGTGGMVDSSGPGGYHPILEKKTKIDASGVTQSP